MQSGAWFSAQVRSRGGPELQTALGLVENCINQAVLDRELPSSQAAAAHLHMEQEHATGNSFFCALQTLRSGV